MTKNNRNNKSWLIPLITAVTIFAVVRPTLAQIVEEEITLAQHLAENNVEVGEETVDGHRQVYFIYDNNKVFITQRNLNSHMPKSSGEYIAYVTDINGEGQIFLYHIVSDQTIQLTHSSTNLDPHVEENGLVAWEGWVPEEDGWQVFLFDLNKVQQLTSGELSMNPEIEGENVIFARRDVTGQWRAVIYLKSNEKFIDVTVGENTREPSLKNGKILLAHGSEEFPLTVNDLLLLDLPALTEKENLAPESVTNEDILEELLLAEEAIDATQATEEAQIAP